MVREIVLRVSTVLKSISNSPSGQAHRFIYGGFAFEGAEIRVRALPRREEKLARLIGAANRQPARFLAHFKGLHTVENTHFFQAALNRAGTHGAILQLFQAAKRSMTFSRGGRGPSENGLGINSSTPSTIGRSFSSMSLRLARKSNGICFVCWRPRSFSYSWRPDLHPRLGIVHGTVDQRRDGSRGKRRRRIAAASAAGLCVCARSYPPFRVPSSCGTRSAGFGFERLKKMPPGAGRVTAASTTGTRRKLHRFMDGLSKTGDGSGITPHQARVASVRTNCIGHSSPR